MRLSLLYFLVLAVKFPMLNSMDSNIDKGFFSLKDETPDYIFCSKLQIFAHMLLVQEEIMQLLGCLMQSLENKKNLESGVQFIFPTMDMAIAASFCLARYLRDEDCETELPQEGAPGHHFLHSPDPKISNNQEIQKLREIVFNRIALKRVRNDVERLSLDMQRALENIAQNDTFKNIFKSNEATTSASGMWLRSYIMLKSADMPLLKKEDWGSGNPDNLKFAQEKDIIDDYLIHKKDLEVVYVNTIKTLRGIILKAVCNRVPHPSFGCWGDYTKRLYEERRLPEALELVVQPVCLAHQGAMKQENNKQQLESENIEKKAIDYHAHHQLRKEEVMSQIESYCLQRTREGLQSLPALEIGGDHSYVLKGATYPEYVTILDPKNSLKLCLYHASTYHPVTQEIDRKILWANYTSTVKGWFMARAAALKQGSLGAYNQQQSTERAQATYITKLYTFALAVDQFLKSLGNEHEIESRCPDQKEKDLCVTIPGYFEELDKEESRKKSCLFVFLQNGATQEWYNRFIAETSARFLLEEYLHNGYNTITLPLPDEYP